VRERASVRGAVAAAVGELGGLDTLVLNAGRPVVGTLHELAQADWDDGIATNLTSIYLFVQEAWPHLSERGGSIGMTASIVGRWGSQNQAAYCATKAGVVMLAKCVALDGAKAGIRANCVCPGFTHTPMLERFIAEQPDPPAMQEAATQRTPLGRLGRPRDIADAFVYLASDEAEWVTGIALTVDGGVTSGLWGG
jgi:NAD(P)-dependent dehydrogenase (short-subunit alcohol dehydrogenase family)